MTYKENPKTAGSGIVCCIPQEGECPLQCKDCFFQSGRSYLEPLSENLPNMPDMDVSQLVVRVNDGNDSSNHSVSVIKATRHYPMKFFNTSISSGLAKFHGPVVLTLNPGQTTDWAYKRLVDIPPNLMFVRVRTNTWNLPLVHGAIQWYSGKSVPIVLTFMAYHDLDDIPVNHRGNYTYRKRTKNSYWAIDNASWLSIMARWKHDPLVYSCGQEGLTSLCKHCGNCLREFFATKERMNGT